MMGSIRAVLGFARCDDDLSCLVLQHADSNDDVALLDESGNVVRPFHRRHAALWRQVGIQPYFRERVKRCHAVGINVVKDFSREPGVASRQQIAWLADDIGYQERPSQPFDQRRLPRAVRPDD